MTTITTENIGRETIQEGAKVHLLTRYSDGSLSVQEAVFVTVGTPVSTPFKRAMVRQSKRFTAMIVGHSGNAVPCGVVAVTDEGPQAFRGIAYSFLEKDIAELNSKYEPVGLSVQVCND